MKASRIMWSLCGLPAALGSDLEAPVLIEAAGEPVRVEPPGYAAPCWEDVDGDGRGDLVVGQFNGGKMRVFRGEGSGRFAQGKWLEADGEVARVPGVW